MTQTSMVQRILTEVDTAIRQFGVYAFQDKGANEVMDLDRLVADLRGLDAEDLAEVLCELLAISDEDTYENAEVLPRLVSDLLCDLQDVDDETWAVIASHPELERVF